MEEVKTRKKGYDKRPRLGLKLIIIAPSRWGMGRVVGHANMIYGEKNQQFIVQVTSWKKGRPSKAPRKTRIRTVLVDAVSTPL